MLGKHKAPCDLRAQAATQSGLERRTGRGRFFLDGPNNRLGYLVHRLCDATDTHLYTLRIGDLPSTAVGDVSRTPQKITHSIACFAPILSPVGACCMCMFRRGYARSKESLLLTEWCCRAFETCSGLNHKEDSIFKKDRWFFVKRTFISPFCINRAAFPTFHVFF